MRDIRVQKNFKMDSSFVMTIVIVIAAVGIGLAFATLSSDFLATIINGVTVISAIIPAAYLLWMYNSSKTTPTERLNMLPFGLLMVAEAAYYITYFQTGNTLNFVALNHTNNVFLGLKYPSTWYISLIALVEISMGPVLAALWVKMGDRQPSVPIKVGLGPVLGGCGFVIIAIASTGTLSQEKLSALWLIACYILLGLGDLILQTSGLSATTKLAPRAFASQSMAVWLAAIALSQGIQAQLVKAFNYDSIGFYFGIQGLCIIVYGVLLIAASRWIKARMTIIE
jgi:POT family proton-dependent oligopeptide transporter